MVCEKPGEAPAELNPTAGSILGFLATFGLLTGWDLDRMVKTSIGNFWNVTRSQVYRELRDLEARGMATRGEPGPRDRTLYQITDSGRASLHAWLARDPGPDMIRNRLLLTVFFSDHLEPGRLAEILATRREGHQATLAHYRELELELDSLDAMAATLRFGISYEEMVIAWIDSLLGPAHPTEIAITSGRQNRRRNSP
ncbi:MAG: PadR family transcriptional regulator [Acidimicrobiales bacterium]